MKVLMKLDRDNVDEIMCRRLDEIHRWTLEDKVSEHPSHDCDEIIEACKVLKKYHRSTND